jgi:hypothetical protein
MAYIYIYIYIYIRITRTIVGEECRSEMTIVILIFRRVFCFRLQGISRSVPEDGATNYTENSTCFYISEGLNFYLWISFVLVE